MSNPIPKYDVFLSFRGEDTREKFTSHVYAKLDGKKIKTFIDDKLERGDEINSSLIEAIEESFIYVIILSEHYASSGWCLDELTEILKCKEKYGREVIPVFYEVDPSDVRNQRKSYAEDFLKHQHRSKDKIDSWKAALTQVGKLSGWDSQNFSQESNLVEKIAEDILKKLNRPILSDYCEGMTGMDKHIKQIQSLMELESPTVSIIGIWGMGGIGKTTIASAIFEKLAIQFNSKSMVLNVQQEIKRAGLSDVKSKYLWQLLGEDVKSSENNFSFDPRLKWMKVLLVFDDVKDSNQLKDLIGTRSNFGQGSRIIVTSRDKQVLLNANADNIYQVREMDDQDSLHLFHSFAFKHNQPIEEAYVSLSKKVLDYANGVPLALQVLGSLLYGKSKEEWESQLQKLEKLPEDDIFNVLKLSYDGLDDNQKDIFLDIACFHRGEYVKVVEQRLDWCGFFTPIGMKVLEDRCLISISEGKVWMHDLIQEMGREIVQRQNKDPGKRSRLWKSDDICDVLKKNKGKGTDAIECIILDMDEIKKVELHAETFKKMHNLRMIKFYTDFDEDDSNVTFDGFLKSFPNHLKILCWQGFPQRSLPQDFCPENLVTLAMSYSHLEQLWEGDQDLPNLKRLILSYSWKLRRLPDLSLCPNIEEVSLGNCESLTHVYSSSFLNKLNWLCLDGCISLQSLDIRSNILWSSSGLVALRGCYNLQTLLISSRTDVLQSNSWTPFYPMAGVCVFDEEMEITCGTNGDYELHGFIIDELCWLDVSNCTSLTCLPAELFNLKFLTRLCLNGCSYLEELPEIKETMENLKVLMLDHTPIKELPSSLDRLIGLEELSLRECKKLKTIPSSIGNLSKLLKLDLTYCESLETFPSSIFKLKLTELDFKGCSMLRTFPEIPNDSGSLSSLTELSLQGSSIVNLPESMADLSSLRLLNLSDCKLLECVPNNIGRLPSLTELSLQGSSIVNLPESMADLSSLNSLNITDCKFLECVPKLPPNLNQVLASDCPFIKRMMLNSRSDSKKGTFQFNLSNSQELDATSLSNIKINDDAYRSVLFCFPQSVVPDWFIHRCQSHSITIRKDNLNLYKGNKLIGLALCVVLGCEFPYEFFLPNFGFTYELIFKSDDQRYFHRSLFEVKLDWQDRDRNFAKHNTFLWKCELDFARIGNWLTDAHNIIFKILDKDRFPFLSSPIVKECGICPLYDDGCIEELSGDAVCLLDLDLSLGGNYTQNKRRKI